MLGDGQTAGEMNLAGDSRRLRPDPLPESVFHLDGEPETSGLLCNSASPPSSREDPRAGTNNLPPPAFIGRLARDRRRLPTARRARVSS